MQNIQLIFEELVRNPASENAGENLKQVALAIWYEDFIPNVENFNGLDAAQAGYFLDGLSCYNCLADEQSALIRSQLLPDLKKRSVASTNEVRDQLAKEWGASFDLRLEFRSLLPYQRRSYRHIRT